MRDEHDASHSWEKTGPVMLLGGLLLPPFAWFLDLQISYPLVKWTCGHDMQGLLLVIPLGSLGLVAVAAWMSWSSWLQVRNEAVPDGGRTADRSYFLALTGLGMSALFGLLILTTVAPRFLLSVCE